MPFIALILGAGPHVGRAVCEKLISQGWLVGLGSRTPDFDAPIAKKKGVHVFTIDLGLPDTVLPVLEKVRVEMGGYPNAVIYNAYDSSSTKLPDPNDPLSLSLESLRTSSDIGFHSVYLSAQFAVKGFATLSPSEPRVFIDTGNPMNFMPAWDKLLTLGMGKVQQAYFVDHLTKVYKKQGYQFYYATQVKSATEVFALSEFSAEAHAEAYFQLVNSKKQGSWDARFIKDGSFVSDN